TPAFMAPEQANGLHVDARCDLFSLGCVLYRMCAGKLPFQGKDTLATLIAVTTEEPPPLDEVNPALPPQLSRLVNLLLERSAANPPRPARTIATTPAPLPAKPPQPPPPPPPPPLLEPPPLAQTEAIRKPGPVRRSTPPAAPSVDVGPHPEVVAIDEPRR